MGWFRRESASRLQDGAPTDPQVCARPTQPQAPCLRRRRQLCMPFSIFRSMRILGSSSLVAFFLCTLSLLSGRHFARANPQDGFIIQCNTQDPLCQNREHGIYFLNPNLIKRCISGNLFQNNNESSKTACRYLLDSINLSCGPNMNSLHSWSIDKRLNDCIREAGSFSIKLQDPASNSSVAYKIKYQLVNSNNPTAAGEYIINTNNQDTKKYMTIKAEFEKTTLTIHSQSETKIECKAEFWNNRIGYPDFFFCMKAN